MKMLQRLLAILVLGTASVLLIQWIIKKMHRRWSGGDYISLYDEDLHDYSPHPHLTSVERRFRG